MDITRSAIEEVDFEYFSKINDILKIVLEKEKENMKKAIEGIAHTLSMFRPIYVFGASHAGILTQEAFYRAGGIVTVNPIFAPEISVERSPITITSKMERLEGYGTIIAEKVDFRKYDILIVHSVSGRNPVTIEIAKYAKEREAFVIGITNLEYSKSVSSRHSSGKKMYDFCDVVIDNHGDIGDASISIRYNKQKMAPTSTVVGATIMNTLLSEAVKVCVRCGKLDLIPVFASANLDGGDALNKELFEIYKDVIKYKY